MDIDEAIRIVKNDQAKISDVLNAFKSADLARVMIAMWAIILYAEKQRAKEKAGTG